MANLNKVMIIGNCGRDADLRYTAGGTAAASFSVAVNSNRRNQQTNEWETETEWFNVTLFGDAAERQSQYITKGKQVYVEGRLRTRSWDDNEGVRHTRTEIIAQNVQLLDRRPAGDDDGGGGWQSADRPQRSGSFGGGQQRGGGGFQRSGPREDAADDIDDLPFE